MNRPLRTLAPFLAAGVLAAAAFTATPAAAESAAARCGATFLPLPAGAVDHQSWVTGADVTGRYAVGRAEIGGDTEQVMWDNGAVSVPPLPFGEGGLLDVNSSGVAVGYGYTMNFHSIPVTWSAADGLRELPVPFEGWEAQATGINSRGDIVGSANDPDEFDMTSAVRWPADAPGTVEVMPGEAPHSAMGVDEDGTVLVQMGTIGISGPAVIWSGDSVESLGEHTTASAISGGFVIGRQSDGTDQRRMLWNLDGPDREVRNIDIVAAVNKHGSIAGQIEYIQRYNGTRIRLQSPGGYPYVTELSDTGVAYGVSGSKPTMWTNCR